jgi:MoaA/NifB/PqqE/SkfB family radical SAM enzyme
MSNAISCKALQDNLAQQFDLICFVDLADMHGRHSNIFDLFRRCYKSEYSANERLVLYTKYRPEQAFLDHIQYAATRIDISNFFILFVNPDDLSDQLSLANQKYGHDQIRMQNLVVELASSSPMPPSGYADRSFLCPLPFMAAQISRNDSVKPCCKYQGHDGNLSTASLQEIFNGQHRDTVRREMLKGLVPSGCKACADLERLGSTSLRQLMFDKYQDILDQQVLDQPRIVDITVSPSSVCNYKCRICKPSASTSIRSEEIRLAETVQEKNRIKKAFPIQDSIKIQEIFSDPAIAPDIVHILGGEPFLWPGLTATLDRLVQDQRSQHIRLEFNTNGSVFLDQLEDMSGKFKHLEILISIDAVGARFELQRGGTWSTVLDNLKKFAQLNKKSNVTIKLAPTINIQNVIYLEDVVKLARDLEFDIVWWYLEDPKYLCIDNVTLAVKHRVKELYENHPISELRKISHRMSQTAAVSGQPFLDYTQKIDMRRNQDFRKFHQEICKLMETQV